MGALGRLIVQLAKDPLVIARAVFWVGKHAWKAGKALRDKYRAKP